MAQTQKKGNNGCLWLIVAGFFTIFAFVFLNQFLGITSTFALLTALVFSIIVTSKILGVSNKKSIFSTSIVLFLFFFTFKFFIGFIAQLIDADFSEDLTFSKNEQVKKTTILEATDSVVVYQSVRQWTDNFGNDYTGDLTIRERDFITLASQPLAYRFNSNNNYWGGLYDYLEKRDGPSLDLVMNMFQTIHESKQLNEMEFAEMVVTCIQDIPYSFVFSEACEPAEFYEESIARILRKCPECCIGNQPYGIQTPVAFLQNLKGDCDTRTVLIYTILKHFNYDVAILNSDFYLHSILGLNIPATGTYKIYNGKKYMLWETTAKYYAAGALPVSFNDVTHWNIVLTSK
ncbi:hypothetical protein ACFQO1_01930 [Jejudonia soesokkakensis]|uniref:Transglutaminase-like domain-containing protein n=1 Tax=Jejudonia soesokkakensis TaxID=1323432 RepID=A0ABW2MNY0_9FLAO